MLWHGLERGRVREEENDKGASGPRELQENQRILWSNGSVIWEKEAGRREEFRVPGGGEKKCHRY